LLARTDDAIEGKVVWVADPFNYPKIAPGEGRYSLKGIEKADYADGG
tara:strand:+ start:1492 stop:1632 length:141 start_codon:yes stop_codon:yes gene_type:complete